MARLLEVRDLRAYYSTPRGEVRAVDGVSFDLEEGEVLGIAGESGSGKSTLGSVLANAIRPPLHVVGGEVRYRDVNIFSLDHESMRRIRARGISIIPQYAMNALNPTSRVRDIIRDLVMSHTDSPDEIAYRMKLARERAPKIGLPPWVFDRYAIELSGGMRQRVTILISTLLDPEVLIADEPTSALDVVVQRLVIQFLKELMDEGAVKSMIFITHDVALIGEIASDIAIMYAGQFVEQGPVDEVFKHPLHPYTKALISSIPEPGVRVAKRPIEGLRGEPPSLISPPPGCRFHPRCPAAMPICSEREPPTLRPSGGRMVRCWLYSEGAR